jgi:Carbamoyl-phosphate synthase L chain, ATP binding domain
LRTLILDFDGNAATYAVICALRPESSFLGITRTPGPARSTATSSLLDASFPLAPVSRQFPADPRTPLFAERTAEWAEDVARICRENGIDALMPSSDMQVVALATHEELWRGAGVVDAPVPSARAAIDALDKLVALEVARDCGVPIPLTRAVTDVGEAESVVAETGYPVVVKARFCTGSVATLMVRDRSGLEDALRQLLGWPGGAVVQEYVPGSSEPSFHTIVRSDLTPLLTWTLKKMRYAQSSLSVAFETTEPLPEAPGLLETLRRLGLWGASSFQLKRDARTGENKLLEINVRFGGNVRMFVPLALRRGINPVVLALRSGRADAPEHGPFPPGAVGVAPGQELGAVVAFVRAKLDGRGQWSDNPAPSVWAFLRSYADTYLRRDVGIDPAWRGLLRDPQAVVPMFVEVLTGSVGTGTAISWGDVEEARR